VKTFIDHFICFWFLNADVVTELFRSTSCTLFAALLFSLEDFLISKNHFPISSVQHKADLSTLYDISIKNPDLRIWSKVKSYKKKQRIQILLMYPLL